MLDAEVFQAVEPVVPVYEEDGPVSHDPLPEIKTPASGLSHTPGGSRPKSP